MGKTVKIGNGQKLPKTGKPIAAARVVLKTLETLPNIGKVSPSRPIVVRCGQPWLSATGVCKDGIIIKMRSKKLIQEMFVKCKDPESVKVAIEAAWAVYHSPVRRRTT